MNPRILYRTHYQVDEPALLELLVKRCTSAVKSSYNEVVAEKLAKEVQKEGKLFNVPAAGYALDLARDLGIVNEQNVWTDRGHLVNLRATIVEGGWEEQLHLNPRERLLHVRLFLEADGAALLYIARYLLEHGRVPNSNEDWNVLAKDLFAQIYTECLKLTASTADRVSLRTERDRIRTRGYKGKSGPHKMFIHLQTLYRLGLVERGPSAAVRQYLIPEADSGRGLRVFVEEIADLYTLEQIVKEHRVLEVGAKVLQVSSTRVNQATYAPEKFLFLVVPAYRGVMSTGTPLCPLSTLIEAIQIDLLASRSELLTYQVALQLLERIQQERPSDVRFHVDRRGTPAFLKLSDSIVSSYVETNSHAADRLRSSGVRPRA
jgi:hypothetical protein